jgi:hypothetical protein
MTLTDQHWNISLVTARQCGMLHHAIRITEFHKPMPTVRRQLEAVNTGLYCRCGEFIAFAVTRGERWVELEFVADQPILILCPICGSEDRRRAEDIVQLLLTEANVRQ